MGEAGLIDTASQLWIGCHHCGRALQVLTPSLEFVEAELEAMIGMIV